jgi:hypothetical protein
LAALIAVLIALGKAARRDAQTLLSVTLNNFFLVAALLAYGALVSKMPPLASAPFFLALGLLLLFPASDDPLNRIPTSTLALWPLSNIQRSALRVASLAFSPVAWLGLLIVIVLRTRAALVFFGLLFVIRGLAFLGFTIRSRWEHLYPPRLLPAPATNTGRLLRLNLRQMICLLDFYLAITVSMVGTTYRLLNSHADTAAFPILAILVSLAFSTHALSIFGLDGLSGLTWLRLSPLPGWRVLLAKDAAYLAMVCVLTLPLAPVTGLTFALVALAIGRYPSLMLRNFQRRWRFAGGDLRFGVAQIFLASGIAFAESQEGVRWLGVAIVAYGVSLLAGGWYWDKRLIGSGP